MGTWRTAISGVFRTVRRFLRRIRLLEVNVYAAYTAYFILLSAFPAMMLVIGLLRLTPLSPAELERMLGHLAPSSLSPLLDYMIRELFAVNAATVLPVSAATALWVASKGVYCLCRGLGKVYTARETRHPALVRLRCLLFTLLLLLALITVGVMMLFGRSLLQSLQESDAPAARLAELAVHRKYTLTVLLLTGLFSTLYTVLPNRPVRFASSLPGGFLSAVAWVVFTHAFSLYVDRFGNYSLYYGSLSVMAMAMLWLYTCMYILLCGGILNCELTRLQQKRVRLQPDP